MNDINELKLILEHRENQWLQHCSFVLEKFFYHYFVKVFRFPRLQIKEQQFK